MSRFDNEVSGLSAVYQQSKDRNASLSNLVHSLGVVAVVFSGSGGALAVAEFAAQLHRLTTGRPARADTPLGFTTDSRERAAGAVFFSAGGRNPDVRLGARVARLGGYSPVVVITCRSPEQLPLGLRRNMDQAIHIRSPKDGFLATSSVIAMTTALTIAYGFELPVEVPFREDWVASPLRDRTIALGGPLQRAPLVDLEARLAETGLSAIQLADLRNFAHGRHVGLARNLRATSVILFSDSSSVELAERTGALLPSEADVRHLNSEREFPASAIELFGASMRLTSVTAEATDVDPARPGVPGFGRKLYRLGVGRSCSMPTTGPVERKLFAGPLNRSYRGMVEDHLDQWHRELAEVRFSALVLDYDGTCCDTQDRYKPLDSSIADPLANLASSGLVIAFASGRGRSLHNEARNWIPRDQWPNTLIGLYNGSAIISLADEVGDFTVPHPELEAAADRIEEASGVLSLIVERRRTQVSVTSKEFLTGSALLPLVRSVLHQGALPNVRSFASGHSVDIVRAGTTKGAVIDQIMQIHGGEVLAIGDQGQDGGNDFELLARTRWSLSVDRVSPDTSRCWNLSDTSATGPRLLRHYLSSLTHDKRGWRFKWTVSR